MKQIDTDDEIRCLDGDVGVISIYLFDAKLIDLLTPCLPAISIHP